jgi:rubrerythrin
MEDMQGALAVIRQAIHNEVTGRRFYDDAAFYCVDPWAKETFAQLATEEERHIHLLLVEYESVETRGRWIEAQAALDRAPGIDITHISFAQDQTGPDLFPSQATPGEAVDRRADDLAALALGIDMELAAIDLYGREREEASQAAAREAYAFLVEEEQRHYEQLKRQWERLAGRPYQPARDSHEAPGNEGERYAPVKTDTSKREPLQSGSRYEAGEERSSQ